ncbi:hypothetical protein, partial [Pseudanabaena biceps]
AALRAATLYWVWFPDLIEYSYTFGDRHSNKKVGTICPYFFLGKQDSHYRIGYTDGLMGMRLSR